VSFLVFGRRVRGDVRERGEKYNLLPVFLVKQPQGVSQSVCLKIQPINPFLTMVSEEER